MKTTDIHVGEDYELRPYAANPIGERVRVLEIGAISRRVRSGARHEPGRPHQQRRRRPRPPHIRPREDHHP